MKTKILLVAFVCFTFVMNGQHTKNYKVTSFTAIAISNGLDVYITQGKSHSVKVEASAKQLEKVKIKNSNNGLSVAHDGKWIKEGAIKVYITMQSLERLAATGGSDVFLESDFKTESLSIAISGGCDLSAKKIDATKVNLTATGGSDIDIQSLVANELNLIVSGGSDVDILAGNCREMNLVTSGGSDVDAESFKVENCAATLSGGADATIYVTENLNLTAKGASDFTCYGKPTKVSKTVTRDSDVEIL